MFQIKYCNKYCNDPESYEWNEVDLVEDCKVERFKVISNELEKYIYLINSFEIIESCAKDLLSIKIDIKHFWRVNKALLNYLNSIYSFKELTRNQTQTNFDQELSTVAEKFYTMEKWYRFVCDFRNIVIHNFVISTDYKGNEPYVDLDLLIDALKKNEKSNKGNRNRQIAFIEGMKNSPFIKCGHYYSIKKICRDVSLEIENLRNEVLKILYEGFIVDDLECLFSYVHCINGKYMYTLYLKELNTEEFSYFVPNIDLESFYTLLECSHKINNEIFQKVKLFYKRKGYKKFYEPRSV